MKIPPHENNVPNQGDQSKKDEFELPSQLDFTTTSITAELVPNPEERVSAPFSALNLSLEYPREGDEIMMATRTDHLDINDSVLITSHGEVIFESDGLEKNLEGGITGTSTNDQARQQGQQQHTQHHMQDSQHQQRQLRLQQARVQEAQYDNGPRGEQHSVRDISPTRLDSVDHPALSTISPTNAPTIYALGSFLSCPTIFSLSMNSNEPLMEKKPLSFKTDLCPLTISPLGMKTTSTTAPSPSCDAPKDSVPILQQQQQPISSGPSLDSIPTKAPPSLNAGGHDILEKCDISMTEERQDEVHPYFAGANLNISGPSQGRRNTSSMTLKTGTSSEPTTDSDTRAINPPTIPHHHIDDQNIDQGFEHSGADEDKQAQEEQHAAAIIEINRNIIDSRSPVFGFKSHSILQAQEERVLREGFGSQPPLVDRRRIRQTSSCEESRRGEYSLEHEFDSQVCAGDPLVPNARAGVSSTLTLEQLKAKNNIEMNEGQGGGEGPQTDMSVESLMEVKDWSLTGLGPRSEWPLELSLFVQMMMQSVSPLAIYWGEQCYLLYNDACRPILKQKHPLAMGEPGSTVWSEVWDVIGEQMAQVRRDGIGCGNKCLRFELRREGYDEECYFDFTFSPIFLQDGTIGGIFAFVQEVTKSILNQRRLSTLNQFSKQAPMIQSVNGAYSMITSILQESNNLDVQFSIVYKTVDVVNDGSQMHHGPCSLDPSMPGGPLSHGSNAASSHKAATSTSEDSLTPGAPADSKDLQRRAPQAAVLCSTSFDRNLEVVNYGGSKERVFSKATSIRHIPDSLLITPEEYEPLDPASPVYDDPWAWPVRSVLADGIPRLVTLPKSLHKFSRALLLPILENPSVLESRITIVLIVGINPLQMLDNQYLDFLALLAANIASLLHFGKNREDERKSNETLFELNKAKISFFQNISHELRTPLTLMMAPLDDALSQTPENAVFRPSLEMARRNTRRLLKLVNTLLQFSRIEAGKGHAMFEETDLTKATREISANFESVARGFGLDYTISCEDLDHVPGGFWVDRAMWSGIILNLIGNALKHTWHGSVSVHQYPCKGRNGLDGVALEVSDTGVGIAAEHLPTLFDRFNRIENKQSRSHEGTGIGLSLVKELTEVHGGTVSVTSVVDKGSCFRLWIPAGRGHHSSTQVKMGDSKGLTLSLMEAKSELMNNKTDASMFVEEASQWIAHKAHPGSTLVTSGTDSTEEDKPEADDEAIHVIRDRRSSIEMHSDFEVWNLDVEEEELSRILIDPPESGNIVAQDNALVDAGSGTPLRRSSSTSSGRKLASATEMNGLDFAEELASADNMYECSVNENGGYGDQVQTTELACERDCDKILLQGDRSRRGFIVVVDDNNDMRAYLREILGKDFRVRCAVDGVDALRLISDRLKQGKRIDLVLSDVAMPNMDGYELLKRIRSDSATMLTPLILLSARAGEEANVEGLDLGADDCLVKPFSARELLARVRSTIRLSDLRHELIREQRHALEMKQLIYSISVKIRSGLSLSGILQTASTELFKVIRCNSIHICRFRKTDPETGQHWVKFVSEIIRVGQPKLLSPTDKLLPKGLEISADYVINDEHDSVGDVRQVNNYYSPVHGAKSFLSVALFYSGNIWGYLLASRDADAVDWTQSEKLLFEQTGNQISLAIAHASLWELKKSQQVEMEAAHAANEAKSQILANTSHELRTPIGAIVGALSALEDTDVNLTGEQKDMIKIMQITSDVALSVINDLLDTAKLEAGAMSLSIKDCPGLLETLEQSVRIFADKAGRKEVDLIMQPSENHNEIEKLLQQGNVIWTDGDRLQQVIMNVIGNAVKFTAQGKVNVTCTFATTESSSEVTSNEQQQQPSPSQMHQAAQVPADAKVTHAMFRFEVSDTGIGIDPDFLKNHIFKSFAQYDQSMTRRFGGTGLGLAISKHLVMMNGGVLGVSSHVGQGSTFYFTWPLRLISSSSNNQPHNPNWAWSTRPKLSPEVAFETRAIVIEPVEESRHLLGWILNKQNIQVTLYENCKNVVQDEQIRQPDLMGPDGSVLISNYRPNAHFFFCARSTTAEITIATARALGEIFKQRIAQTKTNTSAGGNTDIKDTILSIVLVVFSSPQGRSMAKDMIKKIRAQGLEDTVQCRYIVKPVKVERIVECLQMQGSFAPITRGRTGTSPDIVQAGTLQNDDYRHHRSNRQNHSQKYFQSQGPSSPPMAQRTNESAVPPPEPYNSRSQIIPADGSVTLMSSDYEKGNDYNKNTPESAPFGPNEVLDGTSREASPVSIIGRTNGSTGGNSDPQQQEQSSTPLQNQQQQQQQQTCIKRTPSVSKDSETLLQRRMRQRALAGEGSGNRSISTAETVPGTTSAIVSVKSSNDNPAFSNRAARAAAGKRERRGKCVLCVEDNIINLRVVQYQLQKLGYDTQSACDGQVAVDIMKSQIDQSGECAVTPTNAAKKNSLIIAMDSDGTMGSADDSKDKQKQPRNTAVRHHLRIGEGLISLSESNANKSHTFDQSESSLPMVPLTPLSSMFASHLSEDTDQTLSSISVPLDTSQGASATSPSAASSASNSSSVATSRSPSIGGMVSPDPSALAPYITAKLTATLSSGALTTTPTTQTMMTTPSIYDKHPKIDLILMDCAMPIKSGFDAATEIRQMGVRTPIIALTASAVPSTKEKCIASGMNGYLSKPTKLSDLEAMLDQWID